MKKLIYAFVVALVSMFAYAAAPTQAASLSPVTQGDTASQTAADLRQEVGRRWRGGRRWGRGRGWGYRRGWRRGWRGPRFYYYAPYYGRRCWWRYGRRYCRY